MNDHQVDPSSGPAPSPMNGPVEGERHVSEVAGVRSGLSQRAGIGVIVAGGALLCGVILLSSQKPNLTPEPAPNLISRPVVRYEPPPLPPPPGATAVATPPPLPNAATPAPGAAPPPSSPARLLVFNTPRAPGALAGPSRNAMPDTYPMTRSALPGTFSGSDRAGVPFGLLEGAGAGSMQGPQEESLQSRLSPTRLTGVSANVLRNQPFLLTIGTIIPCVLQTAMDSTLPGFVTCVIPQDVQGKTGLTLLDRGTRVVGEFRGGVRQGVERLFVVWTRAETPQGVVISLDSPATDPLGRSGLDGEVDRHFWQRFGGAILMTTVDGLIQAGVASAAKEESTTINTGQAQGIIAETLRGSINIPPTIRKNQGELVSIFVARDLDFATVYRVQYRETAPVPQPPGATP